MLQILQGDVRTLLPTLPDESVQCVVTSPPYWGLRDYGTGTWIGGDPECNHGVSRWEGEKQTQGAQSGHASKADRLNRTTCACGATRSDLQIGLEPTPEEFIETMVTVFREVRRLLKKDGTCWINLGDSYATGTTAPRTATSTTGEQVPASWSNRNQSVRCGTPTGLKPKDLVGIPWRVALALQSDGWYLRQDIIWHKPNPMPESVTDRCTKSHEYLFLLTKSERYFYDAEAIKEPASSNTHARTSYKTPDGWDTSKGEGGHGTFHKNGREKGTVKRAPGVNPKSAASTGTGSKQNASFSAAVVDVVENRNKRSVWTVPTAPYSDAHFATYPPDLIKPCILAGSRPGDLVLDPFGGSGTTGAVALELGRRALLIELNPDYLPLIHHRTHITPGLPL